ncbi:hypothetical protein NDI85_19005 [Halomicroarcula sp. S1AR25-4]|nr:hypothetical protein [Halomicroarcula sp. S1AR25-4]MDS0279876.1 hypothetical protein [Halomicroarcula sp. S1AR25-4]
MVDYFAMQRAIRATKDEGDLSLDQFERQSDFDAWHESSHRVDDAR